MIERRINYIAEAAPYCAGGLLGLLSFAVSRGSDGSLVGCLYGFCAIGVGYWTSLLLLPVRLKIMDVGCHAAWGGGCSVLGLAIDSHLEEMGGMLYFLVPAAVSLIVLGEILIAVTKNDRFKRGSSIDGTHTPSD